MRTIYGFNDQNDFQASKQAGQWYRSISRGVNSEDVVFNENKTFVKIGELISESDDKEAKGTEVVYDISARDWIDDPNGYIFDSDGVGNLYTTNIFSHLAMEVDEIVEVIQVPNSDNDGVVNIARKSTGGGSLVYATSPNTTFSASFTYGATVPFPGDVAANSTALASDVVFYISTPWNTRVSAPDKLFTFWNKIGDDYYLPIKNFFVKPTADYPTSGGITTFTCYLDDSAAFSIGTNTAFPSGVEVLLNGFTNATASLDVREYFNGQTFPATYDTENNKIYATHPRF